VGKKANIFKARYLHGNCGRTCGGYKWEGHAHYPGRSDNLPLATVIEWWRDGGSEISRGHRRWQPTTEGPNMWNRLGT